jgi:flagellar biosynthesis protein FliR
MLAETELFKLFLLVMARVAGLISTAPILGSSSFPMTARVGLTALTSLLITPTLPALGWALPQETVPFAVLALGEGAVGMAMGFVMTMLFSAIQLGGQIMDMQSGFGMMNIFNPALETQFPIFGFFLFIFTVLYMLATNGHHVMLRALVASYGHIPIGGFSPNPALWREAANWGSSLFVDGLMISAPVAAAMMLAYVTMGLLGRLIPQIHLFAVGFPFTIGTAILLVGMMLGGFTMLLDGMFLRMFKDVEILIRGMG